MYLKNKDLCMVVFSWPVQFLCERLNKVYQSSLSSIAELESHSTVTSLEELNGEADGEGEGSVGMTTSDVCVVCFRSVWLQV